MYTIGQLSKKTGVTVRTLDYYDEIELVKPLSKTSGGHRLYDDEDVMRLERVLALKYIGFSLEQIKTILHSSTPTWQQSIQEQLQLVKQEQIRLKKLENALLRVSSAIELEGEVNWSILFGIIQLFQRGPGDEFQSYKEYLNDDELQKMMEMDAQMTEEDMKNWVQVIREIRQNLDADPSSELAQQLVERWANQADSIFGHDEELLGDMWHALKNLKEGMAFYPLDKEIIDFIERVYMAKEGQL
ncbi:MerR family transcriptional regulator [Salirhabdus sp. Marseille-P4669]|uniref:MerR family transcriptional regulator n=1 Tax=Salirhabdus sp. Marseille-P4669 TaxID=2042310 RepID=UPI000C7C88B4|nr:MerR family transcriptional regulator [Salirhabdus sp. Marseille-P4669]